MIKTQFSGSDERSHIVGSTKKDDSGLSEYKSEFEFYPGEFLTGDMVIAPNKDNFSTQSQNVA